MAQKYQMLLTVCKLTLECTICKQGKIRFCIFYVNTFCFWDDVNINRNWNHRLRDLWSLKTAKYQFTNVARHTKSSAFSQVNLGFTECMHVYKNSWQRRKYTLQRLFTHKTLNFLSLIIHLLLPCFFRCVFTFN